MRQNAATVAKKYARALLRTSIDQFSLDDMHNIEQARRYLKKDRRALFLLKLPVIDIQTKRQGLFALCEQFSLKKPIYTLIDLLLEHKRAFLLPTIFTFFMRLYKKQKGIMSFAITSSHQLSEKELKQLEDFLAHRTRRAIIYDYNVNKRLIAGIRMQSDTLLWEYSIAKQLHDIHVSLIRWEF